MARRALRLLLVPFGVALALLVAEAALRVAGSGRAPPEVRFDANTRAALAHGQLAPDPVLFWRLAGDGNDPLDRNIRAIRPGAPAPPRDRRTRVLVLGDSCSRISFGQPPYSAQVEQLLGPDSVEVFNAAVPGYSSHQGLAWLRSQLLGYRPDVVVVYFGWNDHWRAAGLTDRDRAARRSPWRPRLLELGRRREASPLRVPPSDYRENLAAIVRLVRESGGQVVLVAPPSAFTPEAKARLQATGYLAPADDVDALHAEYMHIAREVARTGGARWFDAAGLFAQLAAPRRLLTRDGIHLTDLGHRVLALGLADDIATHDLSAPGRLGNWRREAQRLVAEATAGPQH